MKQLPKTSVNRVLANFQDAELGDPRRTKRVLRVIQKLAENPRRSLPDVMGSDAELEGAYRIINNPHVSMDALHEAHAKQTATRASEHGVVLAISDTTPCHFSHADPGTVGYLSTGKAGFYLHYTLVVAAGETRPLGVSYVEPVVRTQPPRKAGSGAAARLSGFQTHKKDDREFDRWQRGIAATDDLLSGCEVVHIADRESDSYALMAEALEAGRRFVFRVRFPDRKAKLEDGSDGSLGKLVTAQEGVLQREVPLSTRKPQGAPKTRKAHRPRKKRLATLRFSATPMEIVRPRHLPAAKFPKTLKLHVVRVWEPTPEDGETPVEWLLFTTEPIDTPEQIAAVVDMYRARWLIEECNKALKSGCFIEHRQFESREALLTVIAFSLPIACEILALRARARENPNRPATDVLTPQQIEILRRLGSRPLSNNPTAREALWAVAAMGGHQKSNGEPGWLVLQRGMTKLLDYEFAYTAGWKDRGGVRGTDL